jgi:hypothetical protein
MTAATHPATTAKKKPEAGPPASSLDLESIGDLSDLLNQPEICREKLSGRWNCPWT